jgi:glycogen debranching enzyme
MSANAESIVAGAAVQFLRGLADGAKHGYGDWRRSAASDARESDQLIRSDPTRPCVRCTLLALLPLPMATALVRPDILYAWAGPSLLIVDTKGECGPDRPLSGFYFREARFLSLLRLTLNGEAPWLCEAAAVDPRRLDFAYGYPEITRPGGGGTGQSGDEEEQDARGLPVRSFDIRLSYRVNLASLTMSLVVSNRAPRPLEVELAWQFGADFADIQEAQSGSREQEAAIADRIRDGHLELEYLHPRLPYRSHVIADAGWTLEGTGATARLSLAPQQTWRTSVRVVPITTTGDLDDASVTRRESVVAGWRERMTRVEIPGNRQAEEVVTNNVRDIASFPLLEGQPDEWLAMQAGMPLYPAFFGRDAVTAGWQAACLDRGESLQAALTKLGRMQSDRVDEWRDEQPGRIPYQMRNGPLAILNLNPYSAYYADCASPLMYVISLANLWAWTGERRHLEQHWDTARRILDWAREYGDMDGDGYLEYQTRSSKGTKNQGWKDSGDAIIYADGTPVPSPIATCELQAYWYTAQQLMSLLSHVLGATEDAVAYRTSAAALKERFNRDWWMESEQFVALALDPDKRQIGAITSNVGHCLACGIVNADRLPALVGRMFAPDLFNGWGIRTLSSEHVFYNPISYHRGSVWAVEQATTIFGLRRFGFDARALDLTQALFDLAALYPQYRIPECVGGYARGEYPTPGAYPRSNTPQLWNATAFPLVIQTLLGMVPAGVLNTLFVDPVLPASIPELVVRDLRVGGGKVTLCFRRDANGRTSWDVLHRQGTVHIVRQPPYESLSARWTDRTAAIMESVL